MLALNLVAACNDRDEPARNIASVQFFGPPVDFKLGDLVRVEGLLASDGKGNFALFTRSASGKYSDWSNCVVLRDIPWTQKLILPTSPSNKLQARSFEAIGQVIVESVAFGRGDGIQHGPRRCVIRMAVESIKRWKMSDELADQLRLEALPAP